MNAGKEFESQFISSLSPSVYSLRLQDSSGSWSNTSASRFTVKNICDFIIFNGIYLFPCELKSHKGKSLPLSCIRQNQFDGLLKASNYTNVIPLLITNFRDLELTIALSIVQVDRFIKSSTSKSIPVAYFQSNGIIIPQKIKRSKYTYDINFLFENIGGR